LTAVSVIVMATVSVFGSILRITTQSDQAMAVDLSVYLCLFATSPIVILGAPVGSLFLKPSFERILKLLFYTLGFLQFIIFGVLKIGDDIIAWIIISCSILFVLLSIVTHYLISFRFRGQNTRRRSGSKSRPAETTDRTSGMEEAIQRMSNRDETIEIIVTPR